MANPTSSTRERGDRERSSSSRHNNRTVSSTTLLLILSLVLAVLAVMLSLPSRSSSNMAIDPQTGGLMSYLTPKRTRELIARESSVAQREMEVARREAELLGGSPAGLVLPTCSACAPPVTATAIITITEQPHETTILAPTVTATVTQIQELTREIETISSGPDHRLDDVLIRETRVSDREKDVGRREEIVGRRESDASRRENWIMDQLVNDGDVVEEEVVYETKPRGGRKYKELPRPIAPEPVTFVETVTSLSITTETSSIRFTVTVPEPAATRVAAGPIPLGANTKTAIIPGRTGAPHIIEEIVEEHVQGTPPPSHAGGATPVGGKRPPHQRIVEEYDDEDEDENVRTVTYKHPKRAKPSPKGGWFGGRF